MEQSNLVELIKALSPAERERALQFATISFLNQGKMRAYVVPLLKVCLRHPWETAAQTLEKNAVYAEVFSGQPFVEGKLEKLMVEAHKLLRTFLSVQHYLRPDNEFQQLLDFAEVIRSRDLAARYQQTLAKLRKILDEVNTANKHFYHRQFQFEFEIHDHECLHNQVRGDLNVPNTAQALELYYHLNRLELLNRFLLQQKVARLDTPGVLQEIFEDFEVPDRYLEASPIIKINHEIFRLLRKEKLVPADVQNLFSSLLAHEQDLDEYNLRAFYTYLRNVCVMIFNADSQNEEIYHTLHDLYKNNLERGYLHYQGKLHPGTYLAVFNTALGVKNLEWALFFIETYKHDIIDENEQQDYYRLAKASYLFAIGQFSECLDWIPDTSDSLSYLLQGKRLTMKALYELRSELFPYRLDSFKMFMARTSPKILSESQRQNHVEFANLLSQLYNSIPGDQNRSQLLIKRIQERKQAAEWRWLLEKAIALSKRG